MTPAELGALAGLALVDSTSFGTLVVPLLMLLSARVRADRVLVYLGTIAFFYLALGLLILGGTSWLADLGSSLSGPLSSTPAYVVQLVLGVGLFALSFRYDKGPIERRRAARGGEATRLERFRERTIGPDATLGSTIALALVAGVVEAASMLPYLGAIGLLVRADLSAGLSVAVLAGYVLVMIAPAAALLGLRRLMGGGANALLTRLNAWLSRSTGGALGWILGIAGFLLAADALSVLMQRGGL